MNHFNALKEYYAGLCDLQAALALLEYDQQVFLPSGGEAVRARQMETLADRLHRELASARFGRLIEAAEQENPENPEERRMIRRLRHRFERSCRIPPKLARKLAGACASAHAVWLRARQEADYSLLAPNLERIVELKREYAACFPGYDCPYDALIDDYEEGMTAAGLERLFAPLAAELPGMVRNLAARPADDAFLRRNFPGGPQLAICRKVMKAMGYDLKHGRLDLTEHPFTTNIGLADVRITTAVKPELPVSALLSTVHECGHALYEQGIAPEFDRSCFGEGISYGFHESQSRLWENMVGRSRAFWHWLYPEFQRRFPQQLAGIGEERFYLAVIRVEPGEIRTEADEVTYNLHILLRFELEKQLFNGELAASGLRDAWNALSQQLLGVTPRNDRYGVLQDIHWPSGDFGYFPTYALGNLIAAQLFAAAGRALPELDKEISAGNFRELREFLRQKVHRFGASRSREEILRQVCGSSRIEPVCFLNYIKQKYQMER